MKGLRARVPRALMIVVAVVAVLWAGRALVDPDGADSPGGARGGAQDRPPVRAGGLPPLAFAICPDRAVNRLGVGKRCHRHDDCRNQRAVTCLAAAEQGGYPFCTIYCYGLEVDECGRGARCIQRGDKQAVCAPERCADALEVMRGPPVRVRRDCDVGAVNDLGVGRVCRVHADCAGLKVARVCPRVFAPDNPGWCTVFCRKDSECGENAFCWARDIVEDGVHFTVRSCAPVACKE